MKKLAKYTTLSLLSATLLLGGAWQWFWFNHSLALKTYVIIDSYENGDNRLERD